MSIADLVRIHLNVKPEDTFNIVTISNYDVTYCLNGVMHSFRFWSNAK